MPCYCCKLGEFQVCITEYGLPSRPGFLVIRESVTLAQAERPSNTLPFIRQEWTEETSSLRNE
jgi:hypothetical protein